MFAWYDACQANLNWNTELGQVNDNLTFYKNPNQN